MNATNIKTAATNAAHGFAVREWKAFEKNTLRGILSIELPSGLVIHGITLHRKNDSQWLSMPAKEYTKDGERTWAPIVEFASKDARDRFQAAALAAVDNYLAGCADDI